MEKTAYKMASLVPAVPGSRGDAPVGQRSMYLFANVGHLPKSIADGARAYEYAKAMRLSTIDGDTITPLCWDQESKYIPKTRPWYTICQGRSSKRCR